MKKKGSVTVFLCLFMSVLLGVLQIMFYSVQIEGGKVQAIAGVEEGLYSVFAGYDSCLLEKYHIFFLDGAYGTSELNLGVAYNLVKEQLENSCYPGKSQLDIRGENLWKCHFERGEITGYTLATDQGGLSFKQQAVDYMKETLGIQGIQTLLNQIKNQSTKEMMEEGSTYLEQGKNAQENYESEKRQEIQESSEEQEISENIVEVPADFKNPLEIIMELQKKGVLSLVLPAAANVSDGSFENNKPVSKRNREQGMGIMHSNENVNTVTDNLLFQEYMMSHLSHYGNGEESSGMVYQLEYIIGGKYSDMENLKAVVNQLLLMREAANMVYLVKDPVRQAEIHQMALVICSAIGLPAIEGIVSLALQAAWSFGESVLDVRQLLQGGKIPMVKTSATWKLSLEQLSQLPQILSETQESQHTGMDYENYLRILIGLQNTEEQLWRTMDMVENTVRAVSGKENFCMDHCVCYIETIMQININGKSYSIQRSYGYDM